MRLCELPPGSVSTNLIVNRNAPPFDNPELRRAMALAIDRQAFIDILTEGHGFRGAAMQPRRADNGGCRRKCWRSCPATGRTSRTTAPRRARSCRSSATDPTSGSRIKISTRDIPPYRDPAVILLDQLKEIYIDAELEPIDTTQWYPKIMRKDYTVGLNLTGTLVDDPDATALRELRVRRGRQLQRLL